MQYYCVQDNKALEGKKGHRFMTSVNCPKKHLGGYLLYILM